jgi:polyisoprenoid-binding protein YceI
VTHRLSLSAALLALVATTAVAVAEPVTYKIDPSHSLVGFKIRHFFSKVPGRFRDFSGTIRFDEKDLAGTTVDVIIQTASINTENERRDSHLRSGDFFLADSFPTITFKSTKVVPGPDNSALVYGDLTMRGVTKPVTLEANYLGSMADAKMGRKIAGFEAKSTVNRKDFNILWNKVLDQGGTMLGDDVAIDLQVEAVWSDPNAQRPEMKAPAASDKK